MKKIFLKSIWNVRKDYLVLMMVGILIVFSVFFTTSVSACLIMVRTGEVANGTEILQVTEGVFLTTYIVYLFLFVTFLLAYVRKRYGEYEILISLGIKKKYLHRFISMEYFGVIFISLFIGIILGNISGMILKTGLLRVFADFRSEISYGLMPYMFTVLISVVIFGLSFVICDLMITWFGIEEVMSRGKKASKLIAKPRIAVCIGIVIFLVGLITVLTYWGKVGKGVPMFLGEGAIYLLMLAFVGIYLYDTLRKRDKYYKKILWLEGWYHRFFNNINMSFVSAAFMFAIIFIYFPKFLDNYPPVEESNYPYDLVWMANEEDQDFLDEIKGKYNVNIDTIPCIRVAAPDFGEHMGISAAIYEQWTGTKINLSGNEVYVIYQREREKRAKLGIDHGRKQPRLHSGMATPDLWVWDAPMPGASVKFDKKFQIAGEKDQILTGVFESRQFGKLYGEVFEDIIVFSDDYYHSVKDSAEGANLAVLINGIEDNSSLKDEIYAYAKEHSEVNFFDYESGNIIYEKTDSLLKSSQWNIYNIVEAVLNIIGLYLCMAVIAFFKNKNEAVEISEKYRLYTMLGIPKKKRKSLIKKQISFSTRISSIFGTFVIISFSAVSIIGRHMSTKQNGRYCIVMLVGIVIGNLLLKIITRIQIYGIAEKSGKE